MSLLGQTVLIVEDEPLIAHNIAQIFARVGAPVVVARSWHEALKAVATNTFSAAILDGMTGDAELHQRLAKAGVPYMVYAGSAPPLERQAPSSTNRRAVTPC